MKKLRPAQIIWRLRRELQLEKKKSRSSFEAIAIERNRLRYRIRGTEDLIAVLYAKNRRMTELLQAYKDQEQDRGCCEIRRRDRIAEAEDFWLRRKMDEDTSR